MIGKAGTLSRSLLAPDALLAIVMLGCLCAVRVSLAQEISGRVQGHLDEASDCRDSNDFDCARAALADIPMRDLSTSEQYRYWIALGYIEFLDGSFPEAVEAYSNAAVHSPTQETRQYHLRSVAQLHASMGQFQEAYDTLEELLVMNGADPLAGRHLTDDGLWRGLEIYVIGDRDLFPLGRTQPVYPAEAATQGLSQGYVDLEFTVTAAGSTRDVRVIESSARAFESAAIQTAKNFRYKPRLVDGQPVEGVIRNRIEFQSEDLD